MKSKRRVSRLESEIGDRTIGIEAEDGGEDHEVSISLFSFKAN
jgi:hypothetical protein